ncbi:MAG: hypothetical protein AAFX53_17510 [Bacteroidota bacterium]
MPTFYSRKYLRTPLERTDLVIIGILLFSFLLYFVHYLFPSGLKTVDFYLFSLGSNGFVDISVFVWFMSLKLCVIIPLSVWFITSPYWWRYAILSPIALYVFQLWSGLRNQIAIDEMEYIHSLPVILVVMAILFFLSYKIRLQSKILDLYGKLKDEIELLLKDLEAQKGNTAQAKSQFESVRQNLERKSPKEQLEILVRLKAELQEKMSKY